MKYFIIICSIFMMSCSTQKNILLDYNSEGFDITSLKGSSIRLHINPVIDGGEFWKAFENEYPLNILVYSILSNELKEKLSRFSVIHIDTNANMDNIFLNQSLSDGNGPRVKELFEQTNENYLLGIKRVIVSKDINKDNQTPINNTSVNTRNSRTAGGSSANGIKKADACVVKIVAEVWSVKEKKKVAEFTSIGQSKIYLQMYGRALNEALEYSVSNLADYIEEKKE